jgi:cytochrome oxidase assembly protein ShyY1
VRGRWLAGSAIALAVAIGFTALGFWQLSRHHHKQALVRRERAAFAAPADELSATAHAGDRTQATGTYDGAHQVVLRNQVRDGKDGVHVLTPLRLAAGTAVLVDRGWVATGAGAAAVTSGSVEVRGKVHDSSVLSAQDDVERRDGVLSVPRVDLNRIGEAVGYRLHNQWIEAEYQQPAPGRDAPQLPEPAQPDQVNHLQYAIQWFSLAAIPVVGWPIVLRRLRKSRAAEPVRTRTL